MNGWGKIIGVLAAVLAAFGGGLGLAARMGSLEGRMDRMVEQMSRLTSAVESLHPDRLTSKQAVP